MSFSKRPLTICEHIFHREWILHTLLRPSLHRYLTSLSWRHLKLSNAIHCLGIWAGRMNGRNILSCLVHYCGSRACWTSSRTKATKRYGRAGLNGKERVREGVLFEFGNTIPECRFGPYSVKRFSYLPHKIMRMNDDWVRVRFEECRICIRDLGTNMTTSDAPQRARWPMSRSSTSHSDVACE